MVVLAENSTIGNRQSTIPPSVRAAWTPRERLSVHAWADRHRWLQREYSAEPGKYRTARVPYMAEVMDTFADPAINFVNVVKAARLGGTEAFNNVIGWTIDQEPGPTIYVYPRESDVKEELKNRVVPLIKGSPRLSRHIPHAGWDSAIELTLDNCTIYGAWATSQITLLRRTARYVYYDEIDNCDAQSGRLGNTLKLGLGRMVTFGDRAKGGAMTTPSTPDASAWQTWEISDQRKYHVPCPLCGHYQELHFGRIRVPKGERDSDKIDRESLAWYVCAGCEGHLDYRKHQRWMVARGVWVKEGEKIIENLPIPPKRQSVKKKSKRQDRGGTPAERAVFNHPDRWVPKMEGDPPPRKTAGFHVWAAYSPWVTWSWIIADWFRCQHDRERRIVFRNQVLGLPWEEVVQGASNKNLRLRIEQGLSRGELPAAAQVITSAVDVHKYRIHYVVTAWGEYCESWLIDHGIIWVASEAETPLDALEAYYQEVFLDTPYGGNAPHAAFIDSGWRTQDVYRFCKTHHGCFACKGEDTTRAPLVRQSQMEPKRGRKPDTHPALRLWLVNTNECKATLYAWSAKVGDGPQAMHLHKETDDDFVHQFTAHHKVYDPSKRREVWRSKTSGRDDHFLDAMCYDLACAQLCRALSIRPREQSKRRKVKTSTGARPRGADPRALGVGARKFLGVST